MGHSHKHGAKVRAHSRDGAEPGARFVGLRRGDIGGEQFDREEADHHRCGDRRDEHDEAFDLPALQAAKIYVSQLNATGGVGGRKIEFKVWNDQLNAALTRSDALAAIAAGAKVLWVSCDVNYATPAIQVGLAAKVLTVAPCIGTDQMGPSLFGSAGKLAFSFGNAPRPTAPCWPGSSSTTAGRRHRGDRQVAGLLRDCVPGLLLGLRQGRRSGRLAEFVHHG